MKCFDFEIVNFGIFDSVMKFQNMSVSKKRTVGFFEFELFTAQSEKLSFVDDKPIERANGTLICAKPGQTRYSELPFRCHYLHISSEDEGFISVMESLPDVINLHDTETVIKMYEDLLKYEGTAPEDTLRLQGIVCRFLGHLLSLSEDTPKDIDPALHTYRKSLSDTADFIKHNLSEKLTLKTLSEVANLSPIYFHKLFTEKFGKTPNAYILEHRISSAKLALLSDNISISRIATDCGFSTQSYFNNKFKEATGMTPLEYRRYMLGRLKL